MTQDGYDDLDTIMKGAEDITKQMGELYKALLLDEWARGWIPGLTKKDLRAMGYTPLEIQTAMRSNEHEPTPHQRRMQDWSFLSQELGVDPGRIYSLT